MPTTSIADLMKSQQAQQQLQQAWDAKMTQALGARDLLILKLTQRNEDLEAEVKALKDATAKATSLTATTEPLGDTTPQTAVARPNGRADA